MREQGCYGVAYRPDLPDITQRGKDLDQQTVIILDGMGMDKGRKLFDRIKISSVRLHPPIIAY